MDGISILSDLHWKDKLVFLNMFEFLIGTNQRCQCFVSGLSVERDRELWLQDKN